MMWHSHQQPSRSAAVFVTFSVHQVSCFSLMSGEHGGVMPRIPLGYDIVLIGC